MTIYIHTSYYSKFVLKTNPTRLNFLYIFLIKDKGVDELQIQNSLNRHSALATITFWLKMQTTRKYIISLKSTLNGSWCLYLLMYFCCLLNHRKYLSRLRNEKFLTFKNRKSYIKTYDNDCRLSAQDDRNVASTKISSPTEAKLE